MEKFVLFVLLASFAVATTSPVTPFPSNQLESIETFSSKNGPFANQFDLLQKYFSQDAPFRKYFKSMKEYFSKDGPFMKHFDSLRKHSNKNGPLVNRFDLAEKILKEDEPIANRFDSLQKIFGKDGPIATYDVRDAVECIKQTMVQKGPDFATGDIVKCSLKRRTKDDLLGLNDVFHYMVFIIKARNANESFVTGDSYVSWGRWVLNYQDVSNVDNLPISSTKEAVFESTGLSSNLAGCAGGFKLFEKGLPVADVSFSVPALDENYFKLTPYGANFHCSDSGFTKWGSPVVTIECGYISQVRENVKKLADRRAVSKIVYAAKDYFIPEVDERGEVDRESTGKGSSVNQL